MAMQGNEVQNATDHKKAMRQADKGWIGKIQGQYYKIKENAETYPYVWGSYAVVYGGFGLWFAYRWKRLRRTEDRVRVRVLQDRLRKTFEAEEPAGSAGAKKDL